MDVLDEFFSMWCAPEAWCERCGENPALHVVRRNPATQYSGFPTYVRLWDSAKYAYLAVCWRCFKRQVNDPKEAVHQPIAIEGPQPE